MIYDPDMDEVQYGRLLYEEPDSRVFKNKIIFTSIGLLLISFGILFLLIPLFTACISESFSFYYIVGSICITTGIPFFFIDYKKFKIFDKGLKFSEVTFLGKFGKKIFLNFKDIKYIEKLGPQSIRAPDYLTIVTDNDKKYYIADGIMRGIYERPPDYDKVQKIISDKLVETHPEQKEYLLIRDPFNLTWTEEAKREYDKIRIKEKYKKWMIGRAALKRGSKSVTGYDVREAERNNYDIRFD